VKTREIITESYCEGLPLRVIFTDSDNPEIIEVYFEGGILVDPLLLETIKEDPYIMKEIMEVLN